MVCQTAKKGDECFFMSKNACTFNGGKCYPVVERCEGCDKTKQYPGGIYCIAYPDPELKWKNASCNFASHVKREFSKDRVVNALKASKRKAAGKM
jgi:hypothetical protein